TSRRRSRPHDRMGRYATLAAPDWKEQGAGAFYCRRENLRCASSRNRDGGCHCRRSHRGGFTSTPLVKPVEQDWLQHDTSITTYRPIYRSMVPLNGARAAALNLFSSTRHQATARRIKLHEI